jgi:hypothetical protein
MRDRLCGREPEDHSEVSMELSFEQFALERVRSESLCGIQEVPFGRPIVHCAPMRGDPLCLTCFETAQHEHAKQQKEGR